MVHHIILWKIQADKTEEEKKEIMENVKKGLEGLVGQVPGLERAHVQTEKLISSTVDLMLDSVFTDAESLVNYKTHPAHVHVADTYVRPYMELRTCIDYED